MEHKIAETNARIDVADGRIKRIGSNGDHPLAQHRTL